MSEQRESVDPSTVPARPVLRIAIRPTDGGGLEGLVDGRVVAVAHEHEPVRRAVIAAAVDVAARRGGAARAIRVQAAAADGSVSSLVVTAAGEVMDAEPPTSGTGSLGPRRRLVALATLLLVALVALVALVGVVVTQVRDRDDAAAAAPSPVDLPVVAPEPYDQTAAWSVDLGAASLTATEDVVVADPERVYAVRDGGRALAAYDAVDGRTAWELPELGGDVVDGPALTLVDGETVLALATARRLVLLDPATGTTKGDFDLPSGQRGVRMTATGPVVLIEATEVRIVVDGELVPRTIPAGGYPVAPGADGSLVAVANAGQVWTVPAGSSDAGRAGRPRPLPQVPGHELETVAGWTGEQLVLTYRARERTGFGSVRLVAVDTSDWSFQWSTGDLPPLWSGAPKGFALRTGPAGEWGIYGTEAVVLDTGESIRLADDWRTTAVGDTEAFGTATRRPLVATAAGVTPASANSPQLNALTHLTAPQATAGADRVFLVVNSATESVLYALRR